MQIELACRYYAKGWLSMGQAANMAKDTGDAFDNVLVRYAAERLFA